MEILQIETCWNTGVLGNIGDNNRFWANSSAYDVAMTVLSSAPIDDATGLPVPTIAVATDSGVSVIKDDGNVYNDASSSGVTAGVASIEFVNDTLYYGRGGAGGNLYVKTSIGSVSADFSASHYYRYGQVVMEKYLVSTSKQTMILQ